MQTATWDRENARRRAYMFRDFQHSRVERSKNHRERDDDPVPWELDDKVAAYRWMTERGYPVPRHEVHASLADALSGPLAREESFVLKVPGSHSSGGVWVLERVAPGEFLDRIRLSLFTPSRLAARSTPDYWLVEEQLDSGVRGLPVPLDYKFYALGGGITHVTQIDRTTSPARFAAFDGAFMPLIPGRDYQIDPLRFLPGMPVLPRYASHMLKIANDVASQLATAFVRIDMFDTATGPLFGEFTFGSGPDQTDQVVYHPAIQDSIDSVLHGAPIPPLSRFGISPRDVQSRATEGSYFVDSPGLNKVLEGARFGDRRYPRAAAEWLADHSQRRHAELALHAIGVAIGADAHALPTYRRLSAIGNLADSRQPFLEELLMRAQEHHDYHRHSSWHRERSDEVRRLRGGTR